MDNDTQSVHNEKQAPAPWQRRRWWHRIDFLHVSFLAAMTLVATVIIVPNLLRSRMAAKESAAIAACKTYCEAQDIYRRTDWDSDGVLEYKQVLHAVGPRLFEGAAGHGDLDLVDAAFVAAEGDPDTATPKAGYVFKVLTGQGPHAPGGSKSYIVPGSGVSANSMTLGYALIACPAEYDATGRNTFVVDKSGVVYQKDLGPDTVKLYLSTDAYDPDETWMVAE